MELLARLGELDADRAAVAGVAMPHDEAALLEAVEVACQRGAFDSDRPCEVELRAPVLLLQRAEDEPDGK